MTGSELEGPDQGARVGARRATREGESRLSSLTDHDWPVALDSSGADLVRDFFAPALSRAVGYDRAVGYFS